MLGRTRRREENVEKKRKRSIFSPMPSPTRNATVDSRSDGDNGTTGKIREEQDATEPNSGEEVKKNVTCRSESEPIHNE